MDDKETLVRQLAERIYTDHEKYTLMDMEFLVSDLADLCAKDLNTLVQFKELVSLHRNRPEKDLQEEKETGAMEDEDIVQLSLILREVSATGRPIDDLDEIPGWFQGPDEEVNAKAQKVRALFDEAYEAGLINRWVDESGRRGPSTYWDWTTTAHRRASKKGLQLTDPMGEEEDADG